MNAPAHAHVAASIGAGLRPRVEGKFIFLGDEKFYVRGVTYGPFRPDADVSPFPRREVVERDFARIAESGMNAVRTYDVAPGWLLDAAQRQGLRVMAGLPWEQHVTFLDSKEFSRKILGRVRAQVRSCAGHPAILCYAIGNEIPSGIVRWHGPRRVERFLGQLYRVAKAEDQSALVTYVNYPTTEYLRLPFLDLVCFNVYLESQEGFESYLARVQNIVGDRPLLMAEIGLDSRRNGEAAQVCALEWQIRGTFAGGCAGAFVFAWTDEWYRGGQDIEDWDFGLTDRNRRPKRALEAVGKSFAEVPFPRNLPWPKVSVIVCTYNGSQTIRECLEHLTKLNYPDYEVIVVDDGSTDGAASMAESFGFRLIRSHNGGLGRARNIGLEAATGEIVAYVDDDAYPDADWLSYLAETFLMTDYVGVGGPNIPPPGEGLIAQCVANAPGSPVHVLLSDCEAEHIPGCNMAFRKPCLAAIGGFDPQFHCAGDDVDICWRLQRQGWKLGFQPAAIVWHHRRNSVRAYWHQQKGYGKAEALLQKKWPEKYNAAGHVTWAGRIYRNGFLLGHGLKGERIYQGTWGTAAYQRFDLKPPGPLASLPSMPEWYLVSSLMALLCALGTLWTPLLFALPLLIIALGSALVPAVVNAARAYLPHTVERDALRFTAFPLTACLHVLQPLARLWGRLSHGLTPWRRGGKGFSLPRTRAFYLWSETWQTPEARLQALEAALRASGTLVARGGDYDNWDLEVLGGVLGRARLRMAIEEHGAGKQLVRIRSWSRYTVPGLVLTVVFAILSTAAAADRSSGACLILAVIAALLALFSLRDSSGATAAVCRLLKESGFGDA